MKERCTGLTFITADNYPIATIGVALILKEMFDNIIIFQTHEVEQLLEVFERETVSVIIMDISFTGEGKIQELLSSLKKSRPDLKILVFTNNKKEINIQGIIKAGANDYLHKTCTIEEFKNVIVNLIKL